MTYSEHKVENVSFVFFLVENRTGGKKTEDLALTQRLLKHNHMYNNQHIKSPLQSWQKNSHIDIF